MGTFMSPAAPFRLISRRWANIKPTSPVEDAFVTKLNTNLSGVASLVYSTYLGGTEMTKAYGIALGTAGNVFIVGNTNSSNFPTAQQYQTDQPGIDAFVTKLDLTISGAGSLLYSTYLGGDGTDIAFGVATGAGGRVFVTGYTSSTNFPTLNQYQGDQTARGCLCHKTQFRSQRSGLAPLFHLPRRERPRYRLRHRRGRRGRRLCRRITPNRRISPP